MMSRLRNRLRFVIGASAIFAAATMGSAGAQPTVLASPTSAPGVPMEKTAEVTAVFLEQRVLEELATDGVVLSRLGIVLDMELLESHLMISLMDTSTGRTVASTRIDQLPAQRDAAVAALMPVVTNLVAQFASRRSGDDDAQRRLEALERAQHEQTVREQNERTERERVERAEREYREAAIRFDRRIVGFNVYSANGIISSGGVRYDWRANRGETEVPLEDADFYRVLKRPDLVQAYQRRRTVAISLVVVSGALFVGSTLLMAHTPEVEPDFSRCMTGNLSQDFTCSSGATSDAESESAARAKPYRFVGLAAMLGSALAAVVGVRYIMAPHPISEAEARRLGSEYNHKLRHRLGLPVTELPSSLRTASWAPYVSGDGGGVAVTGHF